MKRCDFCDEKVTKWEKRLYVHEFCYEKKIHLLEEQIKELEYEIEKLLDKIDEPAL